tara:strand:+ start:755 stop:1303 length:549 start_codon:yes stop_codon:yes gene_type:complete
MKGIWKVVVGLFALGMLMSQGSFNDVSHAGGPPQPYYADYVIGQITLKEGFVGENLKVAACISGCHVYETDQVSIDENGQYKLALHPEDRRLAGRVAIIYLVNDYGRVRANETVAFSGGFKTHKVDLTFNEPLPVPPDLPSLPAVGDEIIPLLPKYAIVFGVSALIVSFIISRRRCIRRPIP